VGGLHAGAIGGTWRHGIKHTTPTGAIEHDPGRTGRRIRCSADAAESIPSKPP
jgi:hypothetical protein